MRCNIYIEALLHGEQAWTSTINLKSFVMDSVLVGKCVLKINAGLVLHILPL